MKEYKRLDFIDALRGISIFLVVFIHSNDITVLSNIYSSKSILLISFRQIANIAVPLFLFISGYFLGSKRVENLNDYQNYLKKQLPRVLIPFFIWSLFYSVFSFLLGKSLNNIVKSFFIFQAAVPFYFIWLICQFYILQPIISFLSKSAYTVFFSIFISLLSCIVIEYFRFEKDILLPVIIYAGTFTTWICFPVIGGYVRNNEISIKRSYLLFITIIALLMSIGSTYYLVDTYHVINAAVSAVKMSSFIYSIFGILLLFSVMSNMKSSRYLIYLGKLSFGIYFSHIFILYIVTFLFKKIFGIDITLNTFVLIVISFIVVVVGGFIGNILRKYNQKLAVKILGY